METFHFKSLMPSVQKGDSNTGIFTVNFAKFLRTPFLQSNSGRLFLYFQPCICPIFLDKRLVALARLSGALDTTIEILKAFSKQSKLLTSVMPLLKLYSSSSKCFFMVYLVQYVESISPKLC